MILEDQYIGEKDPFEGDLKLWLRSLPEGARIVSASITLDPANGHSGSESFKETFVFASKEPKDGQLSAEVWGVLMIPSPPSDMPPDPPEVKSVEVDFHARRKLSGVTGSGGPLTLKVDMGGAYLGIADDDSLMAPGKDDKIVDLTKGVSPLPGITVNKFELSLGKDSTSKDRLSIDSVSIRSVPTNISLRLGDMPPFWTYMGEMATTKTSTDFSSALNAFLAKTIAEGGFHSVPITIHSDTISRLNITVRVDYQIQQSILPPYLPEATLPYGYSSLPGLDGSVLTVSLPRRAVPVAGTGGKLQGTFDSSRVVFGSIGESGATAVVEVSPDRSLAQPIQTKEEMPVSSIDLPLGNTEPGLAGLNLALQDDADGKPSGQVLVSADISVERPVPGGSVWGNAKLPSEFRFLPDKRYWLTLQSISGSAYWEVVHGGDAMALQASSDSGFSWQGAATSSGERPLQAILRLRHAPAKYGIPVQLQIGNGPAARRVSFERFAPLGRVEFNVDFAKELGEYLAGPGGRSPCGRDEQLINGGFKEPPHDDATYKLFGFSSYKRSDTGIASAHGLADLDRGVDLRVQRFIRLAINDGKPARIDCQGKVPARTSPDEIVSAINKAMGGKIASYYKFSPSPGDKSDLKGLIIAAPRPIGINQTSVELFRWCSQHVPDEWRVDNGMVVRMKCDEEIFAALIALSLHEAGLDRICSDGNVQALDHREPTILSQDIAVSGGCTYILKFKRVIRKQNAAGFKLPSWEVRWLDADGQSLSTQSSEMDVLEPITDKIRGICQFEERLTAPPGSVKAAVSFVQPPPGVLVINDVSIKPTLEALDNISFAQWEWMDKPQSPMAWIQLGGWIEPRYEPPGVELIGTELEDAILAQTALVMPGKRYTLNTVAMPDSPKDETLSSGERARAELRWLKDGAAVGSPAILLLDGHDFKRHSWSGEAPSGVDKVEIRIIQPKGSGNLTVELVSLEESDMISVPFIFLSEAPGQLIVSNMRLVYDLN